jgi:hypothetical protein
MPVSIGKGPGKARFAQFAPLETLPLPASEKPPGDYAVGYGKPPASTRWKPGQSGNPKGPKKGTKHTDTIIREVLFEPIKIKVGSKVMKRPKFEQVLRGLMNKALKNEDDRAILAIIRIGQMLVPEAKLSDVPVTDQDMAALDNLLVLKGLLHPTGGSDA